MPPETADSILRRLPSLSPWPLRLLGLEPWRPRQKTAAEIRREYEGEKWGPLRDRVLSTPGKVTLADVESQLMGGDDELVCVDEDGLLQLTALRAFRRQLAKQREVLARYAPAETVVELGAGFGHIALSLAGEEPFLHSRFLAAEYTASGAELIRHLASELGPRVTAARCDLSAHPIMESPAPAGALVYTSYAACYVPQYTPAFVEEIASWRPRAVVHFEPVYEHCDTAALLGAMQRRYIEVNDYNRNLLTVLRAAADAGRIELLEEQRQVFGANAFLPFSVLVWRPRS